MQIASLFARVPGGPGESRGFIPDSWNKKVKVGLFLTVVLASYPLP